MALTINYFRAIQGATGYNTIKDIKIAEAKRNFAREFNNSINVVHDALINQIKQDLIIIPTEKDNICLLKAKPNESFKIGDVITYNNAKWLITSLFKDVEIARRGVMQKCNLNLKYQNNSSVVLEQPCIISDSYSEVASSGKVVSIPIGKTSLILPYNQNTKIIHKDKRLMIETAYDHTGKTIGIVYNVSGFDGKTKDYGIDGRNLILTIETGTYSEADDNIQEMICNYISPTTPHTPPVPDPTLLNCEVTGSLYIKAGGSARSYQATFYKSDGTTVDTTITPKWQLVCLPEHAQYYTTTPNLNSISIQAADNSAIIGTEIKLVLTDTGGLYNSSEFIVKVVSAF